MKCWSVPSSLFVPGRLMSPVYIQKDLDDLYARKARLEAQLSGLPALIAEAKQVLAECESEFLPYTFSP